VDIHQTSEIGEAESRELRIYRAVSFSFVVIFCVIFSLSFFQSHFVTHVGVVVDRFTLFPSFSHPHLFPIDFLSSFISYPKADRRDKPARLLLPNQARVVHPIPSHPVFLVIPRHSNSCRSFNRRCKKPSFPPESIFFLIPNHAMAPHLTRKM